MCGDCNYIADCIHDFNDHTHSPDEENENSFLTCNFCDESFETLPEVMIHNKAIHASSVQHCEKYLENGCFFLVRTVGFYIVSLSKILILVLNVIFVKKNSKLKMLSENIWSNCILKKFQTVKMKINVNLDQGNVGLSTKKT